MFYDDEYFSDKDCFFVNVIEKKNNSSLDLQELGNSSKIIYF